VVEMQVEDQLETAWLGTGSWRASIEVLSDR